MATAFENIDIVEVSCKLTYVQVGNIVALKQPDSDKAPITVALKELAIEVAVRQINKVLRQTNDETGCICCPHSSNVDAGRRSTCRIDNKARFILNRSDDTDLLDRGIGS